MTIATMVCLLLATSFAGAQVPAPPPPTATPIDLRAQLYPWIPDVNADGNEKMLERIRSEFQARNPTIRLTLAKMDPAIDFYNMATLVPLLAGDHPAIDVLEVDCLLLPVLAASDMLEAWPRDTVPADTHPAAVAASSYGDKLLGVPHWLCGHFLFTRDESVAKATTATDLAKALDALPSPAPNLSGNLTGSWNVPALYLDAWADSNSPADLANALGVNLDSAVIDSLRRICRACERAGQNPCLLGLYADEKMDVATAEFARGGVDSLLGYSERLHLILKSAPPAQAPVLVTSAPLGEGTHPALFVDSFVLRAGASPEVTAAARLFVKYMNDPATLEWMLMSGDQKGQAVPRYLLPANLEAYKQASVAKDPYYPRLQTLTKDAIAFPTVGFYELRKLMRASLKAKLEAK